jgi:transcriptional antiterminator RfaH
VSSVLGATGVGEIPWYAVQTKPCCEDRVEVWLRERCGLLAFLPRLKTVRRRGSRRVTIVEPLFPTYMFVQMKLQADLWYKVKWTPGVKQIVCAGDIPIPVPFDAITLLRERCGDDQIVQWRLALWGGEPVRVVHGPFAGLEGILERPASRGERVRVLLKLLGSATPVEMDMTDIELVS